LIGYAPAEAGIGKEAPIILEGQFQYRVPCPTGRTWRRPETPSNPRVPRFHGVERTRCIKKTKAETKFLKKSHNAPGTKEGLRQTKYTHMNIMIFLVWFWALPSSLP
jgi:hypothetical protein